MGKRRRNPVSNSYVCSLTPHKVRYLKADFAWIVGARQVKRTETVLYIYRCECGGWHLTKTSVHGAIMIDTAAARRVRGEE